MTTFLGNPVTFTGSQLQVGDTAHDFSLTTPNLVRDHSDFLNKSGSSTGIGGYNKNKKRSLFMATFLGNPVTFTRISTQVGNGLKIFH